MKFWILSLCFLSANAFASINGKWAGEGSYLASFELDTSGKPSPIVTNTEVTFTESASSLFIMDCWNYQAQILLSYCFAESYPISGGNLMWNGQVVGTISENSFNIEYDQNGLTVSIVMNADGTLKYSHREDTGTDYLSLEARSLKKAP
jgi:hypothetical protein